MASSWGRGRRRTRDRSGVGQAHRLRHQRAAPAGLPHRQGYGQQLSRACRPRRRVGGPVILDGEIMAIRHGRPDFGLLQSRMHVRHPRPAWSAVSRCGCSCSNCCTGRRGPADGAVYRECERLEELGLDEDPVRTPPWYPGDAADVLAASLATGLEGVVGKPLASTYHPGQCRDWIKVKNVRHQEVIRGRWRRWRRRRRAAVTWTRPGSWPGGPRQRPGRSPTRSGRCRLAEVAGAPAGRGLGRPGLGARPGGQRR